MGNEIYKIIGGQTLHGKTLLHGAKNAVLPLLASSVLTSKPVTICDCPNITDVENMLEVLRALGVEVQKKDREITISGSPNYMDIPPHLSNVMRSSMFMLGALLTTMGEVRLSTPGGCKIGARPLDIHLDGLQKMGATVECGEDFVHCYARRLVGADIVMKYPSVGATENLLMSAVLAKGQTTLIGCAREPEIVALAEGLRAMGAVIYGDGTSVMRIDGVDELGGATIHTIEDRIVGGTMLCAVALNGGSVEIENADISKLQSLVLQLKSPHCQIVDNDGSITVTSDGIFLPCDVTTAPYPLFPTDLQAQLMACQCYALGVSSVNEMVFENRFAHIREFRKMGASIELSGQTATVFGQSSLHGANLHTSDLRGGAGLVIACLKATGESTISDIEYIDRGYENFERMITELGGKICRKKEFTLL